ncbi:hypothetical protein P8V87_05945, partial [Klebsiella pneumoniae]|uniref:hypothetical protein n=1 Tax=Klebsiella pneumoniae TaxID=573 RepID=UPI0024129441
LSEHKTLSVNWSHYHDYLLYVPLERCNLAPMNYLLKGGHRSGHFSLATTGVSDVT